MSNEDMPIWFKKLFDVGIRLEEETIIMLKNEEKLRKLKEEEYLKQIGYVHHPDFGKWKNKRNCKARVKK